MGRPPAHDGTAYAGRSSFSLAVHLPVSARAAAMARDTVKNALRRCGLDPMADDVLVVTSELVTDALLHCGDDIFLELGIVDDVLEIAVTGAGAVVPQPRLPLDDETVGPGVLLVSALTSESGVDDEPRGRQRAWVRFALPPALGAT